MTSRRDIPLDRGEIDELRFRIESDTSHYKGKLPERNSVAWRAYLYGLLEWAMIDRRTFDELVQLLSPVSEDPTGILMRPGHRLEPHG
jgi:hypothetical protein